MGDISVSGKLPAGDGNGLVAIAQQLINQAMGDSPPKIHLCVALVDAAKVTVNADTHELIPMARIRRIEVIMEPEDVEVLRSLMSRALDQRTGREALPYNLEREIRGVFTDTDPEQITAEQRAADDPTGGPPIGFIAPAGQEPLPAGDGDGEVDTSAWPDDPSGLDQPASTDDKDEEDGTDDAADE